MRVLVTGTAGQLGYDLMRELNKRQIESVGTDRTDFDITDARAAEKFIMNVKPDAVIHCAAYTAVDAAEDNVGLCRKINVDGTENIAKICAKIAAKMIYISTDYIFGISCPSTSGGAFAGVKPYEVDDIPNPLNVYGQSKLDGELAVKKYLQKYFIVRTSWVFGKNGNNFVKTMLRLGKEREQLNVVDDQIGSPTYTVDLAKLLVDMIQTEKYGVFHASNEGYCSWAEFAAEIMQQAGLKCKIVPITSAEYPVKAKRPFNSRLSKNCLDKNGFARLPSWQDGLKRYL
ncbi:MAG: dTDP-4-dehydrorhamnose reductase, partial [Phascolarctobacterium sp.]|nr:dTDP-4-dehydrorhamnose reductase [Candidatus Phascolarctobacterium caballi]